MAERARIKREDEELQSEEPEEKPEPFLRSYLKSSKICRVNRSSDNYLPLANLGLSNCVAKSAKTLSVFYGSQTE